MAIGSKDKYDVCNSIMMEGLENFAGTMTANQQRQVFGRNIFGRKTITIDCTGQGRVYGNYSCAYGTDSAFFELSFERIAELSNNPKLPLQF